MPAVLPRDASPRWYPCADFCEDSGQTKSRSQRRRERLLKVAVRNSIMATGSLVRSHSFLKGCAASDEGGHGGAGGEGPWTPGGSPPPQRRLRKLLWSDSLELYYSNDKFNSQLPMEEESIESEDVKYCRERTILGTIRRARFSHSNKKTLGTCCKRWPPAVTSATCDNVLHLERLY